MLLCNNKYIFKQFFNSPDSGSAPHKIVVNYKIELYIRHWGPVCITVPNFMKIGQKVAEIWRYNCFQNGGSLPSWIFEIEFFYWCEQLRDPYGIIVSKLVKIGQTVANISRFL